MLCVVRLIKGKISLLTLLDLTNTLDFCLPYIATYPHGPTACKNMYYFNISSRRVSKLCKRHVAFQSHQSGNKKYTTNPHYSQEIPSFESNPMKSQHTYVGWRPTFATPHETLKKHLQQMLINVTASHAVSAPQSARVCSM